MRGNGNGGRTDWTALAKSEREGGDGRGGRGIEGRDGRGGRRIGPDEEVGADPPEFDEADGPEYGAGAGP